MENQSVFQSKRFWSALLGLIVIVVSGVAPEIGVQLEGIQEPVVMIILALIGAFAAEDVVLAARKDREPPASG